MRYCCIIFLFSLSLLTINSKAITITIPGDTIIPSNHKFVSDKVDVPTSRDAIKLIKLYLEYLKEGKRTMGFVHKDDLDMIEEKKLVETRLFFDSYNVISIGKRMAVIKVYTVRGASISCKQIMLRYYPNMEGYYYLVPGKVQTFEKKMGDITLKTVFLNTWTSESTCN